MPNEVPLEGERTRGVDDNVDEELERTTPNSEQLKAISTAKNAVNAANKDEDQDAAAAAALRNVGDVGNNGGVPDNMRSAQASFQAQNLINRPNLGVYEPPPRVTPSTVGNSAAIDSYLRNARFVPRVRLERRTGDVRTGRPRNITASRINSVDAHKFPRNPFGHPNTSHLDS